MMQVNFGNAMAFSYIESRLKIVVIQEILFVCCSKIYHIDLEKYLGTIIHYSFFNLNLQVQNMSMNVVR